MLGMPLLRSGGVRRVASSLLLGKKVSVRDPNAASLLENHSTIRMSSSNQRSYPSGKTLHPSELCNRSLILKSSTHPNVCLFQNELRRTSIISCSPKHVSHIDTARSSSTANVNVSCKDTRANAKLTALSAAKENADKGEELSLAYAQAIKYVARTNEPNSAFFAESLLMESIEMTGVTFPKCVEQDVTIQLMNLLKERMNHTSSNKNEDDDNSPAFPPPSIKSFHNVLHAWAASKVRRKGLHAEALLVKLLQLSLHYPHLLPDSRAFALTIKCHVGSTHPLSTLDRILHLHRVHDLICQQYNQNNNNDLNRDDPFFLMYSLKSLTNYQRPREADLANEWFTRLHTHVTSQTSTATNSLIDLTGPYTTVLRELARCHFPQASDRAIQVLHSMHELSHATTNTPIMAKVDIKVNVYNLVLRSYKTSKRSTAAEYAMTLLDTMIQQQNQNIPDPDEQTFHLCLQALGCHDDKHWIHQQSQKLLDDYETLVKRDDNDLAFTTTMVYNSILKLYCSIFTDSTTLLSEISHIVRRMPIQPDSNTQSLVLLACSLAPEKDRQKALDIANDTFDTMQEQNTMTDMGLHYMMRCVVHLTPSNSDDTNIATTPQNDRIVSLFQLACQRGFVSYHVLDTFRNHVSTDTFSNTVGEGRLADAWVVHVTGRKCLYTDGSVGGPNKNARRKGKSTSNWVKKQKAKDERREEFSVRRKERKMKRKSQRERKKGAVGL